MDIDIEDGVSVEGGPLATGKFNFGEFGHVGSESVFWPGRHRKIHGSRVLPFGFRSGATADGTKSEDKFWPVGWRRPVIIWCRIPSRIPNIASGFGTGYAREESSG